jgi:transcription antitermination factor NusG
MPTLWYALRSKPNKEEAAWQQARAREFETFYPRLRVRTVNPRARQIKPYFPGYLFVKADLEAVGPSVFQYLPHATGLVCFGGEPASVPEALIRALHGRIGEIAAAGGEVFDGLNSGELVSIHDGPFAGYKAIFDARLSGGERVRVLLDLLGGRRIPVELSTAQIERIKRS